MKTTLKKIISILLLLCTVTSVQAEPDSSWDDWKMRTEFAIDATFDKKPIYFLETVQPLSRSNDRKKIVLTQFRVTDEDRFTERRNTFNLGFGYRHVFADDTAMLGLKLFYDTEGKYNISRWSLGTDLSWKAIDLYANQYHGLSDWTRTNDRASEKSLDGYDIDLAAQIPFMPWVKAHMIYYHSNKERATENTRGRKFSLEGALSLNWTLELGHNTDNFVANDNFMLIRYRWAGIVREHQNAVNNFWSTSAFEMRDMRDYTLERLRRNNSIAVERIEP
jgi:hypothetical protein